MPSEAANVLQPPDPNEKIWRYMDFTKFVSILERKALFFARADNLGDEFEGSSSQVSILLRQMQSQRPEFADPRMQANLQMFEALFASHKQNLLGYTAINCWHLNNHESAAMWKLYLKSDEGIAIQSTYQKLWDCFATTTERVTLGQVRYIDYDTDIMFPPNDMLAVFFHKRRSFEHEREVRAHIWTRTDGDPIKGGLSIPIDLPSLIEKVYVAPRSPSWIYDLVRDVVKQYGFTFPVIHSDLDKSPVY